MKDLLKKWEEQDVAELVPKDFWEDDGKDGKRYCVFSVHWNDKDEYAEFDFCVTKDRENNIGMELRFPKCGKRFKIPFIEEEM